MYEFVCKKPPHPVDVECIYDREVRRSIYENEVFFLLGDDFNKKFKVDKDAGEVAIYSSAFEKDFGCVWIGQKSDFEVMQF